VAGRAGVDGINGETAGLVSGFLQNFGVHRKARALGKGAEMTSRNRSGR
jgi:hypothetical protein